MIEYFGIMLDRNFNINFPVMELNNVIRCTTFDFITKVNKHCSGDSDAILYDIIGSKVDQSPAILIKIKPFQFNSKSGRGMEFYDGVKLDVKQFGFWLNRRIRTNTLPNRNFLNIFEKYIELTLPDYEEAGFYFLCDKP